MSRYIGLSFGLCLFAFMPLSGTGQPDAANPRIIRLNHEGYRTQVAFSPDGKTLATGGSDNQIRFWEVATGRQQRAIAAHRAGAGVSRLSYFSDGKTLVSSGWASDPEVKLWDVATGMQVQTVPVSEHGITVASISPNGKLLAWSGGGDTHLHDVGGKREVRVWPSVGAVDSAAFSPDGKLLATAQGGGIVQFWDVATGEKVRDIFAKQTTVTGSQAVAFSRDGAILVTASGPVRLWKTAMGEELAALGPDDFVSYCVAVSPDGRFVAGGGRRSLRVWDMKTREEIRRFDFGAVSVAFSKDGRWLAFGASGGANLVEIADPAK